MKRILSGFLIMALLGGCASADLQPARSKRTKKPHTTPVLPADTKQPVLNTSPETVELPAPKPEPVMKSVDQLQPAPRLQGKLLRPTRLNRRDGSIMVHVPGGEYLVPLNPPGQHRLTDNSRGLTKKILPDFYLDLTEVTVAQFKQFRTDYDETPHTGGVDCPRCPAMGIDWASAHDYCWWAEKRLPTEEEWEAAARGPTQRLVPWNGELSPKRANLLGEGDGFVGPAPVGSFPLGSSPLGMLDLIGNVWEWVATPVPSAPSTVAALKNPESLQTPATSAQAYLLKGGSWSSPELLGSISIRNPVNGAVTNATFGFRCARSAHEFSTPRP
ncbi:formylglycine-generating enzyme family protein [Nitrospina watsonii]|uniref:FGE-sulfatase domain-containing protein n=1 Tax=Nitrospina watsonii TaxID=1323948 RepID=A0ABN8VX97_9BACT|nr:formylglycine-generating enzyme family protein [Nitrospina watsonii]CAI2717449.1 FGE-sulfatase domain-containing protein [Nitrospina watsonii]